MCYLGFSADRYGAVMTFRLKRDSINYNASGFGGFVHISWNLKLVYSGDVVLVVLVKAKKSVIYT